MSHNRADGVVSPVSRVDVGRRLALALAGVLLYVHGFHPYIPLGGVGPAAAGFAGAFLMAAASYALLAPLSLRGEHRRPNAEVLLVASLFGLLVLLLAAGAPGAPGTASGPALAGLAALALLTLLLSAAYVARPGLFRDPP